MNLIRNLSIYIVTYPSTQWAAVRTQVSFIIDPPQEWLPVHPLKETMDGKAPAGALLPPAMRQSKAGSIFTCSSIGRAIINNKNEEFSVQIK